MQLSLHRPDLVFRISVAGNRDLPPDTSRLKRSWEQILHVVESALSGGGEFYRRPTPRLRLVTGLADGADQLLANAFPNEAKSRELVAILPFRCDVYRNRTIRDKEVFDTLLAQCCCVQEVDGIYRTDAESQIGARGRARAYRAQAALLLRQCDVLVAVAQVDESGKPGGTNETVVRAIALNIPVVWISPVNGEIALWRTRADLDELQSTRDWHKQLAELVRTVVRSPLTDDKSNAWIDEFFASDLPPLTRRHHLWRIFERRFRSELPPTAASLPSFEMYRRRAADLAAYYFGLYRGTFLLNFILAVVAVGLALASLMILHHFKHAPYPLLALGVGKLTAVFIILTTASAANKNRWTERAVDFRYLAERLRVMNFLPCAGSYNPPAAGAAQYAKRVRRQRVADWLFTALVRQALPDPSVLNPLAATRMIREEWMAKQVKYHLINQETMNRMRGFLEHAGEKLNLAVIVAVGLDIAITIFDMFPNVPKSIHALTPWLISLAALIPAAVASLNGIRFQSECDRLADRSEYLADVMAGLQDEARNLMVRIEVSQLDPAGNRGAWTLEALELSETCARIAAAEAAEWSALYAKELAEP